MAIYRIGQASMDADGYITGYGTKWKTALTLIRPGATIVFASNPVAYATISEIINDTSLRATASGGAVVPKGDYVILLHDSLTVDGLAQDVAETLRYYQGKETMYEQFVEFLKNFDWERMEQLGEKVYADSKAAEASANAAKASETNANASKNAAKTSEDNAAASKNAAASSASAASGSATAAAGSATKAKQEADRAASLASQLDATNLMRKDANLSDVVNKESARSNLQVDRLVQGSTSTTVGKSGGNRLAVNDSGEWGALDSGNNWIPLGVGQGGTGARDAAGARENIGLGVSSFPDFRSLELGKSNQNSAAYVDFHYGAKYDYDARIICDGMNSDQVGGGNLRFYAGYINMNTKGSYSFTGGRLNIETTDFNIRCPAITYGEFKLAGGNITVPATASDTCPVGGGLRGIYAGTDTVDFSKASNINLYSWYGVAFCSSFTSNSNGIVSGKPAVLINCRTGDINAKGAVISNGMTLTSDRTEKEDILEIDHDYVLDRMCRVGSYSFRYKYGYRHTCGVMAQELQIWMPELVDENEADGTLNVNHSGLVGYLHASIKALKERNDELEARLKSLESLVAFSIASDDDLLI